MSSLLLSLTLDRGVARNNFRGGAETLWQKLLNLNENIRLGADRRWRRRRKMLTFHETPSGPPTEGRRNSVSCWNMKLVYRTQWTYYIFTVWLYFFNWIIGFFKFCCGIYSNSLNSISLNWNSSSKVFFWLRDCLLGLGPTTFIPPFP